MATTVLVTGDKAVERMLLRLPEDLRKKALRPALRKAAKDVVLPAAKRNLQDQVESGTGELMKSLKVRAIKRSRVKFGAAVILRGVSDSVVDVSKFYGLFLEFGLTKTSPPRRHRKTGKSTGDLPAQPFLRPALYDNKRRVEALTVRAIRTWIATFKTTGSGVAAGKAVRAL